jgi:biotin operon repressor
LALRGKNVSQTARELKISRAAVYFHLNALRDAGSLPGARNGNEEGAA